MANPGADRIVAATSKLRNFMKLPSLFSLSTRPGSFEHTDITQEVPAPHYSARIRCRANTTPRQRGTSRGRHSLMVLYMLMELRMSDRPDDVPDTEVPPPDQEPA